MRSFAIVMLMGLTTFAAGCAKLIVGAPRADKDVPADQEKIQGVWKIESYVGGKDDTPPAGEIANMRLVFKGNISAGITKRPGKEDHIEPMWFKLDTTKDPKQIDLFDLDDAGRGPPPGDAKPQTKAIYKLEGDKFLLAFRKRGGSRPSEFEREENPNESLVIITLTRTTEPVPDIKLKPRASGTTVTAKSPAAPSRK